MASTVVMYGLMYVNTFALDHIYFSQTRSWMAVMMGAAMSLIMIAYQSTGIDTRGFEREGFQLIDPPRNWL
ncbi:hypothetical protein [Mesorhizobium captivum]|uniref:hypothetical protein n=1 Tax=Mesorhizobium captivum TaxID=3072319 RepID=UPI002A23C9F5|nr:hypothetical protein [Mesorhizobium sp. VK3C]MDX8450313.1 hypothetical protein [Mesorhizobium sp. VK3C]